MLEDPEFEPEFYANQISMMEIRYSKIFKSWGVNWESYYDKIQHSLRKRQYWIWVYLCGFEKFIQDHGWMTEGRKIRLKKDAEDRIRRIIGDSLKIEEYIKSL